MPHDVGATSPPFASRWPDAANSSATSGLYALPAPSFSTRTSTLNEPPTIESLMVSSASGARPRMIGTMFLPNELSSPFGPSRTTSFFLPPGWSVQCAGSSGLLNFMPSMA
ncbi:MAG: hypothetical protein IT374_23295 [Polyangiaceae bacterium]|nr:hypothetical protein [Polyangiaceae bacterium]